MQAPHIVLNIPNRFENCELSARKEHPLNNSTIEFDKNQEENNKKLKHTNRIQQIGMKNYCQKRKKRKMKNRNSFLTTQHNKDLSFPDQLENLNK